MQLADARGHSGFGDNISCLRYCVSPTTVIFVSVRNFL
jgi:hypothetical protein